MTQVSADFELGVDGDPILTTDAGSATAWDVRDVNGGTVSYDNAHAAHGTLAAEFVGSAGVQQRLEWTTALGTLTDHYGRTYLYMDSHPAADFRGPLRFQIGGAECMCGWINSSGQFFARDAAGSTVGTMTTAISTGAWIRFEWHIVHNASTGVIEFKLFNSAESYTPTETLTLTSQNTAAQTDRNVWGVDGGTSAHTFWLDDIVAGATSYPGPVSTGQVALPTTEWLSFV